MMSIPANATASACLSVGFQNTRGVSILDQAWHSDAVEDPKWTSNRSSFAALILTAAVSTIPGRQAERVRRRPAMNTQSSVVTIDVGFNLFEDQRRAITGEARWHDWASTTLRWGIALTLTALVASVLLLGDRRSGPVDWMGFANSLFSGLGLVLEPANSRRPKV